MQSVTIYYLEMRAPELHREKTESHELVIQESCVKQGKVNRFLYDLIGDNWHWVDNRAWSLQRWNNFAEADQLRTWIALSKGSIAGYFELLKVDEITTEIAHFGLAPSFVGKGFGGYFLSQAINAAWSWETTERVIVNTCSLDHPAALSNYKARGFQIYDQRVTPAATN